MSSRWLMATGLALAVVLLLAVNIFSNAAFTSMRADLTEGGLYTLTEGTRNVLAGLAEPVRLRLFLSEHLATRLPRINSYAKRVRELLGEYERAADGKLTVEVIDPEPFSPEEDRAVGYGLRGIPLDEESTFYFGLGATGSTDQETYSSRVRRRKRRYQPCIPRSTDRPELPGREPSRLLHGCV